MEKSDTRIKHTKEEYLDLVSVLQRLIRIVILEIREEVRELTDILFLYSLARACVQIDSIFRLWDLEHYSDSLILYRTQVERLLTLHYLVDTKTIKEFDDWSFIENYENRNNAKSDQEHNQFLTKEFWTESRERIEKYQRLKKEKVSWKRPDSSQLEDIARKHNLLFLYKYGYRYASGFVHPLSSDGEAEFELVTGIKAKNKKENDTTPIINNSVVVLIFIIDLALNETNFEWNEYVFKILSSSKDFIENKSLDYKENMKIVEYMIENNYKIS
jgi:hypothetical protein